MSKSKLPTGWSKSRIGDLIESRIEKGLPEGQSEFTYIDISSVDNRLKKIVAAKTLPINKAPSRARQQVKYNDVIVSTTRPNLNAVALLPTKMHGAIASTGFAVLRPILIDPRWLYSVVQSEDFVAEMCAMVKGVLYPAIRPSHVHDYVMPVPPLAEQKRITRKLAKLLKRTQSVSLILESLSALIQQYRVSVLEAACTGRLVPTEAEIAHKEGRNFEPASALLEKILIERRIEWERQELARMTASKKQIKNDHWKKRYREPEPLTVIPNRPLPTGWQWGRIDQCGVVQLGRQRTPAVHTGKNLRPYLRVANVFENRIDISDVKQMNFTPEEFEVFRLEPNDILLNEGQSLDLVGRPAIYRGEIKGACFQNTLIRFRPLPSLVPEYALAVFRHYLYSKRFRAIGKVVTNLAHLGAGRFADLEFPLPPLAEQKRIIHELEFRLSAIDNIEKLVSECSLQLAELHTSFFRKAMSGCLVEENKNDEPAKELLARVAIEREKRLQVPRRSKSPRKEKMNKLSPEIVKEAISKLPADRFSFEELSAWLQADYESLKNIVFELLDGSQPILRQVFDSPTQTMQFERATP